MISGTVISGEAVIQLSVRSPAGWTRRITAVIDTGYDGWLTLPPDLIDLLQLRWLQVGRTVLGDGSDIESDIYEATVVWDRRTRLVEVDESNTTPLIGMAMLDGHELNIQVRPRGKVTIKPLSQPRRR